MKLYIYKLIKGVKKDDSFFSSNSLQLDMENEEKKETKSEVLVITENEVNPTVKSSQERINNILNSHKESEKMIDNLVKGNSDHKLGKVDICH